MQLNRVGNFFFHNFFIFSNLEEMQASLYRSVLREIRLLVRTSTQKGLASPVRLPLLLPSKGVHPPWGQGYEHAGEFELSTVVPTLLSLKARDKAWSLELDASEDEDDEAFMDDTDGDEDEGTDDQPEDFDDVVPPLAEAWLVWNELVGDATANDPSALVEFARACWGRSAAMATAADEEMWKAVSRGLGESEAFDAIGLLGEQLALVDRSSAAVTEGVRVEATSQFLQMSAEGPLHCYRIGVVNEAGPRRCQLVSRHWRSVEFFDPVDAVGTSHSHLASHLASAAAVGAAEGEVIVPKGSPGVVGHSPVLARGEGFTYMSGTAIGRAKVVAMFGSFGMTVEEAAEEEEEDEEVKGEGGEEERRHFDVVVAPFPLVAPTAREQR